MSNIMDDWFGFDPPPKVPTAQTPARPAPTRKTTTSNVVAGVDAARKLGASSGGSSRTDRTLLVNQEDVLGVGINV